MCTVLPSARICPYFYGNSKCFPQYGKAVVKSAKLKKSKNESTSASAVVLTGLHHDQGPCPIKSQRVEYRYFSRKRRKTLLISYHLGVYRREVRHKIGSRVAFLSRSLCAARISASTTEALLTFPVTWRLNPTRNERTCRRRSEWVNDVFCCTCKWMSFQQSDERWNNDIDSISQHNSPFLASTSSFGLACDRTTILSRMKGGSSTSMTDFFVKWEGRVMPASFSRARLVVFFLFFWWENIGDKIRKIIRKSAKRRPNDPQFEGKGLATLCVPGTHMVYRRHKEVAELVSFWAATSKMSLATGMVFIETRARISLQELTKSSEKDNVLSSYTDTEINPDDVVDIELDPVSQLGILLFISDDSRLSLTLVLIKMNRIWMSNHALLGLIHCIGDLLLNPESETKPKVKQILVSLNWVENNSDLQNIN